MSSCNTSKDGELEMPASYEFTRNGVSTVDFSGQTERLDMLDLMAVYMKESNTLGVASVEEDVLNNMFGNVGNPFPAKAFEKDLKSKCFKTDTVFFQTWFHEIAVASQSTKTASEGVAGVMVDANNPTTGYRVNANGIEPRQIIVKGLMGAVFFYQAMDVYLSEERMGSVGNNNLEDGENYTEMEHYCDEAFGYFGVSADFPNPATLEDGRFWGEYVNTRNEGLYPGINEEISLAFRTIRAAIVAKDYEARDQAIQRLMQKWSIVIAASAVGYLEKAKTKNGLPQHKKHHVLSEAIGFMLALKYHFNGGNSKFPPHYTFSKIKTALLTIGPDVNLYSVSDGDIDKVISQIKEAFPAGDIK
ncbi:DUF4856 domain-containing protein [Bacteroidota bacterium]